MAEKEYIDLETAYDMDTLEDWYINSVSDNDTPVWTEEHLEELLNDFYVIPKDTPAADVAPVKHAQWAYCKLHGQSGYYCSECGTGFADINPNAELIAKSHDYCPKCGAKMDGGEQK